MLQKLVVEFHDELEALGVRVDEIEGKVNKLDSRLGGWKISGQMRFDLANTDNDEPNADSSIYGARYRIWLDKWFGEDEQLHFRGRLNGDNGNDTYWDRFYVEMPFFFDSKLTVGRNAYNFESAYYIDGDDMPMLTTGALGGLGAHLTDRRLDAFEVEKQFGLGAFKAYLAHPNGLFGSGASNTTYSVWELAAVAQMQFNEQFGFDLGGQLFVGDNSEPAAPVIDDVTLDKMWTIFAGLRFNFNEAISFKAIYYGQKYNGDVYDGIGWNDGDFDSTKNWKVALFVSQDALKFTNLWLEYGQADEGFGMPNGGFFWQGADWERGFFLPDDVKYFRIAATQYWNEKWSTGLFYNGFNWDDDTVARIKNVWGLGVEYTYTPEVHFGLSYINVGMDLADDDHVVMFRTQVDF
jgi:hypothetical protein